MPVKSLVELASAACLKNIRELESVGDYLPYENVRHILLKVDNAPQLRQIEINSPQIEGETGEIWLRLIERDFPMEYKAKAYKPQNPSKWYRVWEKYKKDHDRALQESEKKLMIALAGLKEVKEKNTSKIVDRKLLPRVGRIGPKRGWGQRDTSGATLTFGRGSRTKTANGASVMRKVRREVKEIASIHGALSRPSRASNGLTRLQRAPAAMVNDVRREAQPVYRPTAHEPYHSSAVEEYEERATFLSDSEEDDDREDLFDDDDDDDDDDELPPSRPTHKAVPKAAPLAKKPIPSSSSSSSSPLKRQASPSNVIPRRPAAATAKRSGILSNSYKPASSKPQTKPLSSATTTAPKSSQPRDALKEEPARPSSVLPQTQTSPPLGPTPGASSPPPMPPLPAPQDSLPRKRKAVNIFMNRKKRA